MGGYKCIYRPRYTGRKVKTVTRKPFPWEAHYPDDVRWDMSIPSSTLPELFHASAKAYPQRTYLYFLGKKISYSQVEMWVDQCAVALKAHDIGKGDRVGVCLPNTPFNVIAYYAILQVGAVVVNMNPLYTEDELQHIITDSGVKLVFTLDVATIFSKWLNLVKRNDQLHVVVGQLTTQLPALKACLFKLLKGKEILPIPNTHRLTPWHAFMAYGRNETAQIGALDASDIAVLQYTGGTTGVPKGAMLSHGNLVANVTQVQAWLGEEPEHGDIFAAVLPFFHVFAMTGILNLATVRGAGIILHPKPVLKNILASIHKYKPTLFFGVPTLFNSLAQFPQVKKYNLTSLRYCVAGGAGLPQATKDLFESVSGCTVIEGYGLTESSPVAACNPRHKADVKGSIGLPLSRTEISIRNPNNLKEQLPTRERGEICIKGPQVMVGYWQNTKATEGVMVNGWLRTGDIGFIDTEGYVYLTDRAKDVIISNGYNIYPRIIEEVLYRHENVEEVCVIAIPDVHKGEVPKAFITRKPDTSLTEEDVRQWCSTHLNKLEQPAEIEFRVELPKTLIGKLSKKELVEEELKKREQNNAQSAHNS